MRAHRLNSPTLHYVGQLFGSYRLVDWLGQGGYAIVYLGEHRYLGTQVAVKLLRSSLIKTEVEAFLSEARIAAHLIHPHIIRVLDFGLQGQIPYLVMDFAPNGTLCQFSPPGTQISSDCVIEMTWQITDALCAIHERGLVHRDLKPSNVLIGRNNELMLSDFGITIGAYEASVSSKEMVVGSVAYMAPEQIQGYPCPASDQYSLGVMVYEWLSGVLPFRGTPTSIAYQHLYELPPSLCQRNPSIPLAVEHVIARALAKDPRNRFPSIEEFAEALEEAFERDLPVKVHYQESEQPDPDTGELRQASEIRSKNIWREICLLFAFDLLVGMALCVILYIVGVQPQSIWFLFTLCIILIPLGSAFIRKSYPTFFLTITIVIVAALPAVIFHSLILFVSVYLFLLAVSLLLALTVRIQGY